MYCMSHWGFGQPLQLPALRFTRSRWKRRRSELESANLYVTTITRRDIGIVVHKDEPIYGRPVSRVPAYPHTRAHFLSLFQKTPHLLAPVAQFQANHQRTGENHTPPPKTGKSKIFSPKLLISRDRYRKTSEPRSSSPYFLHP